MEKNQFLGERSEIERRSPKKTAFVAAAFSKENTRIDDLKHPPPLVCLLKESCDRIPFNVDKVLDCRSKKPFLHYTTFRTYTQKTIA